MPAARARFIRWLAGALRSRITSMIQVAGVLRRHRENILTDLTSVTHWITNAMLWIERPYPVDHVRRPAFPRLRVRHVAMAFHCRGLDLEPRGAR